MKYKSFLIFTLTSLFIGVSFSQENTNNNFNQNSQLEVNLLQERLDKYNTDQEYILIELKMVEKGFTFPALVKQFNENGKIVFQFRAYKINVSNTEEIKNGIMNGVPSISNVEISENFVKATFHADADEFHIKTLFRYLGYNSFALPN